MNKEQQSSKFADLLKDIMNKRWYITAMVLGLFILITAGIFIAILIQAPMAAAWKELLMLLLGAFIGSYGKIIDYYYSDSDKDKMLVQKADEEDGVSMSHTNDMKETNKPVTPLIPDAFIAGAQAARELAVVENKQNYDLTKDEQEHRQILEVDEQEHEQEMVYYCHGTWFIYINHCGYICSNFDTSSNGSCVERIVNVIIRCVYR